MSQKDLSKHLPEGVTWIKAAVSAIPMVGGPLGHLIFDKADSIRLRNIETALAALAEQIKSLEIEKLNKSWFESEEALAAFKTMAEEVSYEPDSQKVNDLGYIVAACGSNEHINDDKKLAILEHLARLSHTQIKILSVIATLPRQEKTISTGGLEQQANAIWFNDIASALQTGPSFWSGTLMLVEELELLESYNTVRQVQLMGPSERAYELTALGRRAASYLHTAKL